MSCKECKNAIKAFLAANREVVEMSNVGVICLACETIYTVKGIKMLKEKLSLCKACMSMTYTILDNGLKKCGKCKYAKEQ
jgi:uncharacterized protein YjfI (DUF2170 family)